MEVSPWYLSRAQATVGKTLAQLASQDCAAGRLPAPGGPGTVQGRAPLGDDSLSRCSHEWSAHQPTPRMCQLGDRGHDGSQRLTEPSHVIVEAGFVRGDAAVARPALPLRALIAAGRHHHQVVRLAPQHRPLDLVRRLVRKSHLQPPLFNEARGCHKNGLRPLGGTRHRRRTEPD